MYNYVFNVLALCNLSNCVVKQLFAFQCQETTPTNSFACENTDAWKFIPVLIFVLLLCPQKTRNIAPQEIFPLQCIYIQYDKNQSAVHLKFQNKAVCKLRPAKGYVRIQFKSI